MTIRHLNIFVTVCREGGITAAAKKLYMAQPAVSQVIREMEKYYGIPLFDRISRKLYLTAEGEKLYRYATALLAQYEDMERAMQEEDTREIHLGTSITIGSHMLPVYIRECRRNYPEYQVYVQIQSSQQVQKMLLANQLDFGLIEGQVHSDLIQQEKFANDRLAIICPPGHELTKLKTVSLKNLVSYPLLLRERGSGAREIFDGAMQAAGLAYRPCWESVSTQALVNGVRDGVGISALPEKMVEEDVAKGRVSAVYVREKSFLREYHIITHKHKRLSNAAKNLIQLIKQVEQAR